MLQTTKRAILSDVKAMSFALVAERYGLTRNQVAGIVWRAKNPSSKCTRIKNQDGVWGGPTCGRGRHGPGSFPAKTLSNTR